MKSYQECLEILNQTALENSSQIQIQAVDITNSIDQVLASDIYSNECSPAFDNSAMDGFAVNLESLIAHKHLFDQQKYLELSVVDCVAAGDNWLEKQNLKNELEGHSKLKLNSNLYLKSNLNSNGLLAIEIMTGAPVPPNFNSVIKIEDTKVERDQQGRAIKIKIFSIPGLLENIRKAGEDIHVGQLLLPAGTVLQTQHLLGLATIGYDQVKIKKNPNIAILSTGKELVNYKTKELQPGMIRNSTGVYLEIYFKKMGFQVLNLNIVNDSIDDYIAHVLKSFQEGADIIISTGAVSMGKFDFVKPALEKINSKIHFHKSSIRPGKPILFAETEFNNQKKFIFGVPGNPISTAVGLRFFILPFINQLIGKKNDDRYLAELNQDVTKPDGLTCFFKAIKNIKDNQQFVQSLPGQASFMVSPMFQSNGWVILPENGSKITKGTKVEVCEL